MTADEKLPGHDKRGGPCRWCGHQVGLLTTADGLRYSRSLSIARLDRTGLFCTLRCAAAYGVQAAAKAPA